MASVRTLPVLEDRHAAAVLLHERDPAVREHQRALREAQAGRRLGRFRSSIIRSSWHGMVLGRLSLPAGSSAVASCIVSDAAEALDRPRFADPPGRRHDLVATRIVRISTSIIGRYPNVLLVEIQTADGLVGLGETLFGAAAVSAYIHETAAPFLLGQDARDIPRLWGALYRYWGRSGIGAETRGASAIDIALWDLAGKRARPAAVPDRSVARRVETSRPTTPAVARPTPAARRPRATSSLATQGAGRSLRGPVGLPARAGGAAREPAGDGLPGDEDLALRRRSPMRPAATGSHPEDLDRGLEPFRLIRDAFGWSRCEVALELHGRWNLPSAVSIAQAIEPFAPMWIEDPIRMDNIDVLAEFVRSTTDPDRRQREPREPLPVPRPARACRGGHHHDRSVLGGRHHRRTQGRRPRRALSAPVHAPRLQGPGDAGRRRAPLSPRRERALSRRWCARTTSAGTTRSSTGLPLFEAGRLSRPPARGTASSSVTRPARGRTCRSGRPRVEARSDRVPLTPGCWGSRLSGAAGHARLAGPSTCDGAGSPRAARDTMRSWGRPPVPRSG